MTPIKEYGYHDTELVKGQKSWSWKQWVALVFAFLLIFAFWYALDRNLIHGEDWISPTYDNEDWRTNEGNLHTFGAWDIESHIWKTEYIAEHFPDFHWNPYWYLGMPLVKYYQLGFYFVTWGFMAATGLTAARSTILLLVISHLVATLLTFLLCYKVSRRILVSALCSVFLLSNTFISLRSYGWEPITVVFIWLFPLGLLLFLKEPLRPFRFWLILVVGLAYVSHPLIWFTLLMSMGLYLFTIGLRKRQRGERGAIVKALRQYVGLTFTSILIGAVQFLPQFSYTQASSGAHMGVTYLPFYQVPYNIISIKDFFFDAGNLKGPGPIIMIALFLIITFAIIEYWNRKDPHGRMLKQHEMIAGLISILAVMILFYYIEFFNIFPMNVLRSIQYHRIIPEFIIVAAVLVAVLSNIAYTKRHKLFYYTMLITFVLASTIIVYNIQGFWETTDDISKQEEFIYDNVPGRITFPYTDQSLSVRNSWTKIPQVYGYYEQGITNSYDDEMFSVSSGFHNAELTVLYLQAGNVGRLYVNMQEGERDEIVRTRLNGTLEFVNTGGRYSYFKIPLNDPSFAQAISVKRALQVEELEMGCREKFKEHYCGSVGEEFVSTDTAEQAYLRAYVDALDEPYDSTATMRMEDPDHYYITVTDATEDTGIIVKMTYDADFTAHVDGVEIPVKKFGPDFMLLTPGKAGEYTILLEYHTAKVTVVGAWISILTILVLAICFLAKLKLRNPKRLRFEKGEL